MWHKEYRDYKIDTPLIQQQIESGRGIIGAEMHELNGWSNTLHQYPKKEKRGILASLLIHFFKRKKEK